MTTAFARAEHAIPVVPNATVRDALFPNPVVDQRVQNLATGYIERWNGVQWLPEILVGNTGPVVNLQALGAKGDGNADDTAFWQLALNLVAAGGRLIVPRPTVGYKLTATPFLTAGTNVEILGDRALFILASTAAFGLRFAGAASGVRVRGLRMQGTGVIGDAQRGIGEITAGSATGDDVLIEGCEVWNVTAGIFFDNGALDSWHKMRVHKNNVHDIFGTASGTGYGIAFSTVNGGSIEDNDITNCQRHSIYQSAGERNQIYGNRIYNHRQGLGQQGTAAIQISRASQIIATLNQLFNCEDIGCSIEPREAPNTGAASRNIQYIHNIHKGSPYADLWIGTQSPATDNELSDVLVADNDFYRPAGAANSQIPMRMWSGKRARIARNRIYAENAYTIAFTGIYLPGTGGAQYTDDVTIEDNTLATSLGGGGSAIGVELGTVITAGASKVRCIDNKTRCSAGTSFTPISLDAPLTNPNIEVRHPATLQTLAYSASMTPNPESGSTVRIIVTNGTAFTVNAPGNYSLTSNLAYGMEVELDFLNSSGGAMGTVTFAAIYKLAGAFVAPANTKRRLYRFYFDGTNLVERYRSAADI